MQYKLGIIGAGKIGEAILAGSLSKGERRFSRALYQKGC